MLVRRAVVSVPLLLAVAWGGAPAVAAPSGGDRLVMRTDLGGERAGRGPVDARAESAEEGVIRRTARLTDVQHATAATPSQRLSAVDVVVDVRAQIMTATVTLDGAVDPAAPVVVVLGTWDGRSCVPLFGAEAGPGGARTQCVDESEIAATQSVQGNQVSISSAAHPRLGSSLFECAYAHVVDPANPANALSIARAVDLEDVYQPVLEVEADDKVVGARKGKWAKVRLEVRNTSRGAASAVRIAATGKGIEIKTPRIDVGPIDARSTEYLDLRVRLEQPKAKKGKKAKAPKPRTLTLTVTDPAAAPATGTLSVVLTPKPTIPKKLTGTYWWGWEDTNLSSSAGWINHSVWFVDRKWAYTGWAEGKKPRCSAKVKECRRYSYDARTGRLKIGKEKVKVTSEGFAFTHPGYGEKLSVEPLALPKKGTKLGLDLYHQNWSGFCTITCTAYTDYLTMDRGGRFVEGGYSVGSWTALGSSWASAPADQRGTYKIVRTGIIEMTYADGTRRREVIGIQHDPSGKPNPAAEGVLLGDTNFYE